MSDSVRPHRRQPTRLPRPWDSPGKNTGVGGHFLLQRRKVKSETEVAQLCSLPGSSVPGILHQEHWSGLPFPSPTQESETNRNLSYTQLSHQKGELSCPEIITEPTGRKKTSFLAKAQPMKAMDSLFTRASQFPFP